MYREPEVSTVSRTCKDFVSRSLPISRLKRDEFIQTWPSILLAAAMQDLKSPEAMFRALGAKLAVGMPFKDIATSDSILLREVPAAEDAEARRALRRLAVQPLPCPTDEGGASVHLAPCSEQGQVGSRAIMN